MSDDPSYRRRYTVRGDAAVFDEIECATRWIARDSLEAAHAWSNGLFDLIEHLGDFVAGYALARENEARAGVELREFLYHSHRVIYAIDDEARVVQVLHVWHAARRNVPRDQLP